MDDIYVMYKLRKSKFHPEVGLSEDGWSYGCGYDLNRDWSVDIFWTKDWNLRGKPRPNFGVSMRF